MRQRQDRIWKSWLFKSILAPETSDGPTLSLRPRGLWKNVYPKSATTSSLSGSVNDPRVTLTTK